MLTTLRRGPRPGPHRYRRGDVLGRWTVVRHASPVERWDGRKFVRRHRVHVRCECGHERDIEERALYRGESSGCASRECIARREQDARTRSKTGDVAVLGHGKYRDWRGVSK